MQNHNDNVSGAMFFVSYVGPSMNPTLHEPEILEIMPYGSRPFCIGDVSFFLSPETNQPVVHRIIRVNHAGISTLGDNNNQEDILLLQPKSIKGQVVAAWRGQKRRKIAGGLQGLLMSHWLRWRRVIDHGISPLLHPLYQTFSRWGLIARVLPAQFRPRVVVFNILGREQLKILLGQRIIGQYDNLRHRWHIQRPYKLFVNEMMIPGQQDKDQLNWRVLTERQLATKHLLKQGVSYYLVLADGSHWEIAAGDEEAASIVSQAACAMQLGTTADILESSQHDNICRVLVRVAANKSLVECYVPLVSESDGAITCILNHCNHWGSPYVVNLVRLALVFARESQARGGALIHGALAERDGIGVILAAPCGTGKTTASSRFPSPWRSLCDDTTLVVRDLQGKYWAHPWPTWSRFMYEGSCDTWDVQRAVPVKGFFFLAQAAEDRVERIGSGQAVSLLVECVKQTSTFMEPGLLKEEVRTLHLERFDNLCALAKVVPSHMLHISQTGSFWQKIEQVI